ncbi:sigma-54 interaction domain-containing protein [Lutispora thermophila]|uniref:Transcriptional regulator containing PAS, AAA-type ATPase, and DNA-binding Fis domains n=1 Tax=Lutispora thermophila DSM 19022 TaxID=1122184 RepID=A0A1M6BEJ6_9FIRM|nr:sigma 54-interacting transcriptional regulator [Lutispora thermophila]SHI47139.1 Transcriptional regulator containing PAS, AAA-type ATPase, and DNA-binding Fis domains [Lutispora thermophila DSM 19022]
MFSSDSYAKMFTDMMSEGFIFIDNKGKIQLYNNKAKEIFGITSSQGASHRAGKIEEGDIVIIGDNCLGKDDGNMTPEALGYIGIHDSRIRLGDAIVAVGRYGATKGEKPLPLYKYVNPDYDTNVLELYCSYMGMQISSVIDFKNKNISITVDNEKYVMSYINYIGHIVVIDGRSKELKFYQYHGYTARGEGLYDILTGKRFMAKGENSEMLNVIGKDIFEIHKGGSTIKDFYAAATGADINYENKFEEINGRPTICTLMPVDRDGKRVGAVLKVEDISEIKRVIRQRDEALLNLEQMEKKLKEESGASKFLPEIIGESKEIINVKRLAMKAAKSNSTLLILGESGTGKSMLARAIHNNSKNRNKPFIHVNCGSIPETLLESELFGYEGGAFTGAKTAGKAGMFELAQGGTIFLDEIGEMSPTLQIKLLQVLQDKTFYKVGGSKNIEVDVRIIVATNKNLEEEMIAGRFREDLYYRINVFPIWIPPLRERKEDIYLLVQNMLPDICKRIGCETKRISGEALNILSAYDWPGNVRELENILERAVNLAEGNTILSSHLAIKKGKKEKKRETYDIRPIKDVINDAERRAIEEAIMAYNGDKKAAMRALKMSKTSFYEKLKKYNIE